MGSLSFLFLDDFQGTAKITAAINLVLQQTNKKCLCNYQANCISLGRVLHSMMSFEAVAHYPVLPPTPLSTNINNSTQKARFTSAGSEVTMREAMFILAL